MRWKYQIYERYSIVELSAGKRSICSCGLYFFISTPDANTLTLVFIHSFCSGYTKGIDASAEDGTVLINTEPSISEDGIEETSTTGLVPDFWSVLVAGIGEDFGSDIELEWQLYDSSQDVFDALQNGEIDSACGYWFPQGQWRNPETDAVLARPLAFSMQSCPTLIQTSYVYTSADGDINSLESLTGAINSRDATAPFRVCVAGKYHCVNRRWR